ncbi:hypothetical protein [Erythrobacter sp. THAF29]|uniref:hypothetical protein n=1 Tax=Erythrobacter sp. THAF29 TaxID=2587851 RepID=UPI001268564B|nr:hypothetical protein [Erythrobacter sp. THAF29]QFT78407.1 hypothetical protein FIU90_12725 [Erythrobacter sp. THAF29]
MLRTTILIAATALLSACGSERSGEFTTEDGERGEYMIDSSTGETTARIETPEGEATLRSGANVPVELPDGFSVYPGATVVSNTAVNHGEGKGNLVLMQIDASPDDVIDHYRDEAEDAGFDIQIEMTVNEGKMIGGEGPGDSFFSVNASQTEGEPTQAQLMLGSKLGG